MRTTFTFANRAVRDIHSTSSAADDYAEHVLSTWKTVPAVVIHGDRREGYPYIKTVTRDQPARF